MSNLHVTPPVDANVICRNFPEFSHSEILRDNLLDVIDGILDSEIELTAVEGCEGIGKTTLLAQFARRHRNCTLSLFINPSSRLAYSPEYARLVLTEQLAWIVRNGPVDSNMVDEGQFRQLLYALQGRAQRFKQTYYFIIDGLDALPQEDERFRDIIMSDVLPFGFKGFRFVISGELEKYPGFSRRPLRCKAFPLPPFSADETARYLIGLDLGPTVVHNIHRMCGGVPGHLESAKRILEAGVTAQKILDEAPDKLQDFIRMEWGRLDFTSSLARRLLAIIAFARNDYTMKDLANLLSADEAAVEVFLNSVGMLTVDPQHGGVRFVSEAHRRYAAGQLSDLKEEATNLLIESLARNADDHAALKYLPDYLDQAGRLEELLDHLSPSHFVRLLETSQSLEPLSRRADLGLRSALKLDRDEEVIRFCIHGSAITHFGASEVWRSEIEARMALKDYESALCLAQNTVLKEDRLLLLAVIARMRREQGLVGDVALLDQIRQLSDQIPVKDLGPKALEVARELLFSDADLAIKMLETAVGSTEDDHLMDLAFLELSMAALQGTRDQEEGLNVYEKASSRIKDPEVQNFLDCASVLYGDYTAPQVIARVKNLHLERRMFFLRTWARSHRTRSDAADVIDYALDLFIKDSTNYMTTRDLRELATAVVFVPDPARAGQLVARFDSLRGSLRKSSPPQEYVRLELLLAQVESRYDISAARNRVLELYWQICDFTDLAVKTESMAWLVASLKDIDRYGDIESQEGLQTVAREELLSSVHQLLEGTASHFGLTQGTIEALSGAETVTALQLAKSLNTSDRRDKALVTLIKYLNRLPATRLDFSLLCTILDAVASSGSRDNALLSIIERLSAMDQNLEASIMTGILPLLDSVKDIRDAFDRCKGCCLAYVFLAKQDKNAHSQRMESLLKTGENAWQAIDVGWRKVDMGYKAAAILATTTGAIASKLLADTDAIKSQTTLHSEAQASAYSACLRLLIGAYSALLPKNLDRPEDLESISTLIDHMPSNGEKAVLWADVALRLFTADRTVGGSKVVEEHVIPLIHNIQSDDAAYRYKVVVEVAAALFCAHQLTCFERLSTLPRSYREAACVNIRDFIFTGVGSREPYGGTPRQCILNHAQAIDICQLLGQMDSDVHIYSTIGMLSEALSSRQSKRSFLPTQRRDIAERIVKVIEEKLPDSDNIRHQGYAIAALAHVAHITQDKSQTVWQDLIKRCQVIPNASDRALTLSIVACAMPSSLTKWRDQILEEARVVIDSVPADLERLARYEHLADTVADANTRVAKSYLKAAMGLTLSNNDEESVESNQTSILSKAYRIDRSFVSDLISIVGASRTKIRERLERSLEVLEAPQMMTRGTTDKWVPPMGELSSAARTNLGRLHARRISPIPFESVREYLRQASRSGFDRSRNVLAWAIENEKARWAHTDQARARMLPLFDAVLRGGQLVAAMAARSPIQSNGLRGSQFLISADSRSQVIKAGDRQRAIQFLRDWFTNGVKDYLKICDPYFGPEDLEILKELYSVNPLCKAYILTSRRVQDQLKVPQPRDEAYRTQWYNHISDQAPPDCEVLIVGTESGGDLPIHDRWWLTKDGGLRFGTSFNSLGVDRSTEISVLTSEESKIRELEVDQYLQRLKRSHKEQKLLYHLFTL